MKALFTPFVFLLFSSSLLVAGGFQLNEHGARGVGQGGAWVARAYDLSAMYYNPAGLAFQRAVSFSVGTTLIAPVTTYWGIGTGSVDMEEQLFTPINAYVGGALTDDISLGFGVCNPYGLGTEWDPAWSGRFISTKADLMSFSFNPTIAMRLSESLAIGAGVNFSTGTAKLSRKVSDPFFQGEHLATIDADGTGWGFNVGVIYRFDEDLSFGASYRSSVVVDAEGTATFTPSRSYLPSGSATTSLELPSTGFVGLSYKVMQGLEIEADVQYVGWSSYDSLSVSFGADGSSSSSPKLYENTYILRVGGEYTMGDLQLRAGYFFDNNPVKDTYVEPTLPDVDRHGFNVGVGYAVSEGIQLDLSYMFLKGVQRKVTDSVVGFDGTYSTTATLVGLSVSYTLGGM